MLFVIWCQWSACVHLLLLLLCYHGKILVWGGYILRWKIKEALFLWNCLTYFRLFEGKITMTSLKSLCETGPWTNYVTVLIFDHSQILDYNITLIWQSLWRKLCSKKAKTLTSQEACQPFSRFFQEFHTHWLSYNHCYGRLDMGAAPINKTVVADQARQS